MIKGYLVEPNKQGRVIEFNNTLKDLQHIIGGYVQFTYYDDYIFIVDEEGRLKGLKDTFSLPSYGTICGNVLIVRNGGEDIEGLTEEDIKILERRF